VSARAGASLLVFFEKTRLIIDVQRHAAIAGADGIALAVRYQARSGRVRGRNLEVA